MSINIYERVKDVHYWHQYNPSDLQYFRYDCNTIFACHKISDVYETICVARANLQ